MSVTAQTNVINAVIADHRLLERVFAELDDATLNPRWRRALADQLVAKLVTHLAAEEHYMYPLLRDKMTNGRQVADHELGEHADLKRIMHALDDLDGEDPRFTACLVDLRVAALRHFAEEENEVLSRLNTACSPAILQKWGAKMLRNKRFAPRRPRPDAPDRPPGNLIADAVAGFIDRRRYRSTIES